MEELITKHNQDVITFLDGLEDLTTCLEAIFKDVKPLFNADRYLTDKEISEIMKISRRTLQDYRDQGIISYIQLGGKILYRESDWKKLLESNYIKAFRE